MPEQRIHSADFVEAHLVDQLFEYQRIIGKEIDAPFPIIESDRASDDLSDVACISAAHESMFTHLAGAFRDRQLIPVLVFTAAPVHWIKAGVAVRRDVGIKPGFHRFFMALKLTFNLGFPLIGVRLNALIGQFLVDLERLVIKTQFDNRKVGGGLFQIVAEAQVGQLEFGLIQVRKSVAEVDQHQVTLVPN